jgi:hypothetical protein
MQGNLRVDQAQRRSQAGRSVRGDQLQSSPLWIAQEEVSQKRCPGRLAFPLGEAKGNDLTLPSRPDAASHQLHPPPHFSRAIANLQNHTIQEEINVVIAQPAPLKALHP